MINEHKFQINIGYNFLNLINETFKFEYTNYK